MRFTKVIGGITAALLVSGVSGARLPKRQDAPPVSSETPAPPAPPASTETPVPPPPASTETPTPPETLTPVPTPTSSEAPAPPPPSSTEAPAPPPSSSSEVPAPPPPTSTKAPVPPTSTEAPAPPSSTPAPPTSSAPPAPVETCATHLLVDDFSQWETGENSLQGATSDDQTMNATSTDGGILTFTPNNIDVSYIYEQFDCLDTVALGYDSISFNIKGPEAASVSIELQTVAECSSTEYQSFYYTLDGLSGSLQTINIPLNSWEGAGLEGVVGVLWYGFSAGLTGTDNVWQLDNVQFLCASVPPPEDPEPPVVTPVPTTDPTEPEPPVTVTTTVSVTVPSGDVTTTTETSTGSWSTPGKPTTTGRTTTTKRPGWPTITTRPIWPTEPPWWDDDPWDDPWGGWSDSQAAPQQVSATAAAVPTAVASAATEVQPIVAREAAAECDHLLVDDFISQSRLTFLYYNALLKSSSDDGTMKSVVVKNNRVTFTPVDTDSYWYTQLGCIDAEQYGGISLRISAAAGTTFDVQLSSTKGQCGTENTNDVVVTSKQLGWTFNGKEQLYSIPFSKFKGLDLTKFETIFISNLKKAVTFGPLALYCGNEVVEYVPPAVIEPSGPTETVPAPPSKATNLVIDKFANSETNALEQWHGADEGMTVTFKRNTMTLQTNDSDLMWVTQVSETCKDLTEFDGSYLHVAYTGSNLFTVALQQHNEKCNNDIYPYPETWDSLEASRYSTETDIWIPLNHFNVDRKRAIGFAFKGFYSTAATVFSKIEIVNEVPDNFQVPEKLPSGQFIFACKRPNSFAFAIDDGDPVFAQQVMKTIDDAGITVTFFTVGAPLRDPTTNLSAIYNEMASKGHQIALHSYTHPPLEGLADDASIDWEYTNDIEAVKETFNGLTPKYFRPPFGTEGARMRQRLAALIEDPYIVQWSVDVEDWLWAESDTPEKQLEAFKRDVAAGGNIVVMHYLYNSTVSYLEEFIQIAKATGKQLMRVDQCMMDPNAPPLPGEEQ
ncbi:polysaccharide deacetylase [Daldinia childiae]|uniref:polysaccharide deacetylase n=1 Tax=Daldinia childiae TaxID=326645 RepID=UPI001448998B|nr:polysaccharide deacetylase [Daldinia childiae]KAF3066563.1 polysaccharide deacetylase [Daldinia childiae]